jgi:hypothetical protein
MSGHQVKTQDAVTIHVVEMGNPSGQAILFVHGVSQSWRGSTVSCLAHMRTDFRYENSFVRTEET